MRREFKVCLAVVAFAVASGAIALLAQPQQPMVRNDPVAGQSLRVYPVARVDASLTTPITYGGPGRVVFDTVSQCLSLHRGDAGSKTICTCDAYQPTLSYKMAWSTTNRITVSPRVGATITLRMEDGTIRSSAARTFDITNPVAGDDALDAGAEAANTWYYLYAINKTATTFVLSASATTPAGGGPATSAVWKYLGAFRNDAGSNIIMFYHLCGNKFSRELAITYSYVPCGTGGPNQMLLTSYIPATASAASMIAEIYGGVAGGNFTCYVDEGAGVAGPAIIWLGTGAHFNSTGDWNQPTPAATKGYWQQFTTACQISIGVNGWIDEFVDWDQSC